MLHQYCYTLETRHQWYPSSFHTDWAKYLNASSWFFGQSESMGSNGIPPLTVRRGEIFIIQLMWEAQKQLFRKPVQVVSHVCWASFRLYTRSGVYTLRPRQNGHHLADDILKCNFFSGNVLISITISRGPINNILAFMMTSSNGNIFHITGPLCGKFTVHRWIPLIKASDAELWCFLWS